MRVQATGGVDGSEQPGNPSLARLFVSFLRLGITAFGGPAMVACIRKMAVNQKQWLDDDSFRNGIALSQTIPGATSTQAAALRWPESAWASGRCGQLHRLRTAGLSPDAVTIRALLSGP